MNLKIVSILAVPVTMGESAGLSLALSFCLSKMDSVAMYCQSLATSRKPMRQHEALDDRESL